jgi:hypothetical protein
VGEVTREPSPLIDFDQQVCDLDPRQDCISLSVQALRLLRLLVVQRRDLQHAVGDRGIGQGSRLGQSLNMEHLCAQFRGAALEVRLAVEFGGDPKSLRLHRLIHRSRQEILVEVLVPAAA